MTQKGTLHLVGEHLVRVFEPLVSLAESPGRFHGFMKRLGHDVDAVPQSFVALAGSIEQALGSVEELAQALAQDESLPIDEIASLLEQGSALYRDLKEAGRDLAPGSADDAEEIGVRLFELLMVDYLAAEQTTLYTVLLALGAIEETYVPASNGRSALLRRRLDLGQLLEFPRDPSAILEELYGWGTDDLSFPLIADHLLQLLTALDMGGAVGPADEGLSSGYRDTDQPAAQADGRQLEFDVLFVVGEEILRLGLVLLELPPEGDAKAGLILQPDLPSRAGQELQLAEDLTLQLAMDSNINTLFGVVLRPGGLELRSPSDDDSPTFSADVGARLSYSPDEPIVLLGRGDQSRLQAAGWHFGLFLVSEGPEIDLRLEAGVNNAQAILAVSEMDNFLASLLGSSDVVVDVPLAVQWSRTKGLTFAASAGFEVKASPKVEVGPVTVTSLTLAARLALESGKPPGLTLRVGAGLSAKLGPLSVTAKGIGVSGTLKQMPEGKSGQAGPFDIEVGFAPPSGLGLSIDTGAVSGEGFLEFHPEENRYVGAFDLQVGEYGIGVLGLLKTEIPGEANFSLLLLVTADLPRIDLGFGFALTGVGGLAGIHRAFKKKPLARAVRSGSMSSVLFPENVVDNADQIFSDLRTIFPPRPDHHVFGPMVKLVWGSPVVLRAQLGVLVSIPTWKIALAGKFLVDLPDEKAALIDLNLAVLGVLDIPNKSLSIDASLYDSRVVQWSLSGDMAMRLTWGKDARFLLSVGGFHPRYDPPDSFPELDRVRASLSVPGGSPRLEMTGYLAVTPNTFQVGAAIVLHAEAGPAQVDGELSFDALFRFNPFSFVVDFYASLTFSLKGKTLGITVDGTLSGPQPYRVKGKVHIEVLFFDVTIHVNVAIGPSGGREELPEATVLPRLIEALEKPENWLARPPDDGSQLVTLRERSESEKDRVLIHPLGTIGVRQQIVPLEVEIEKYGNTRPQHTHFRISAMSVQGESESCGDAEICEQFAPARFCHMTDDQKLQAQAFEKMPAGRMLKACGASYDESRSKKATLAYEVAVIDRKKGRYRATSPDWETGMPLKIGEELAKVGAVARAKLNTTGAARYRNEDNPMNVTVSDQRYVMVWTDSLERVEVEGNPSEGRTRVEAQDRMRRWRDDHPGRRDAVQIVGRSEAAS